MLLQFLQTLIIFKKIFGPQYTELICSATTIHLPASPTYCCFTTLGKQANWFVITLATKLTHNRCTKLKKNLLSGSKLTAWVTNVFSSVVTLFRQSTISSLKITVCSFRYQCITSYLQESTPVADSFRQPRQSCLESRLTSSFSCQFISVINHHPHYRHPSLLHSFTPGSKPTFSTNPSYLNTSTQDCLHDHGTGMGARRIFCRWGQTVACCMLLYMSFSAFLGELKLILYQCFLSWHFSF